MLWRLLHDILVVAEANAFFEPVRAECLEKVWADAKQAGQRTLMPLQHVLITAEFVCQFVQRYMREWSYLAASFYCLTEDSSESR